MAAPKLLNQKRIQLQWRRTANFLCATTATYTHPFPNAQTGTIPYPLTQRPKTLPKKMPLQPIQNKPVCLYSSHPKENWKPWKTEELRNRSERTQEKETHRRRGLVRGSVNSASTIATGLGEKWTVSTELRMNQHPPPGSGARKTNSPWARTWKNGMPETVRRDAEMGRDCGGHRCGQRRCPWTPAWFQQEEEEEEEDICLASVFSLDHASLHFGFLGIY